MGNTARNLNQGLDYISAIGAMSFETKNTQKLGENFEEFCKRLNLAELEELFLGYQSRKLQQYENRSDTIQVANEERFVKIYLYQSYLENVGELSKEQQSSFEIFKKQISVIEMVGVTMDKE